MDRHKDEPDVADWDEANTLDSVWLELSDSSHGRGLDEEQHAAVQHRGANLRIIAGPGSGKTRTLTHRAISLLKEIPPESLMVVTFTKKAAQEISERIRENVSRHLNNALKQSWIGTIHSACWRILHENGHLIGLQPGWSILNRFDSERVMKRSAIPFRLSNKAEDICRLYSYARNSLTNWRKLLGSQRFPDLKNERGIEDTIRSYERRCRRSNRVDFDDLQVLALKILHNYPDVREAYRKRFRAILVDEYQDTNTIQAQLLRLLATSSNITVVGDDAQSIYSFRAATVENILNFPRTFTAETIELRTNYRSSPQIVSFASESIKHNPRQVPKHLRSAKGNGPLPQVYDGETRAEEAQFVIDKIGGLYRSGVNLDEIAVLFRATRLSAQLITKLKNTGIPYVLVGGEDFFDLEHIKSVLDVVRLLVNPEDTIALSGLRDLIGFSSPSTLEYIEQLAEKTSASMREATQRSVITASPREKKDYRELLEFYEMLDKFQTIAADVQRITSVVVEIIKYLTPYVRKMPGITWDDVIEDWKVLVDVAGEFTSLSDFVNTLALEQFVSEHEQIETKSLTLSTIHSAKGREWDAVFVIGLVEFWFPLNYAIQQSGTDEEERRLFYVAVTRARKYLYITHYKFSTDQYGRNHTQEASRFIQELPKTVYEKAPDRSRTITDWEEFKGTIENEDDLIALPSEPDIILPSSITEALSSPTLSTRLGAIGDLAQLVQSDRWALATAALTELKRLSEKDDDPAVRGAAAGALNEKPTSNPDVLTITSPIHLELVCVPAGEFLMGSDPEKDGFANRMEWPQHKFTLPDFYIGKYPVTIAQYTAFARATGQRWSPSEFSSIRRDYPAVNVSWYSALAFCEWLAQVSGKNVQLPSEAQWEKAARSTDGQIYPWGNETPTAEICNFDSNVGSTTPVGRYSPVGDSPYGCADMAGNIWEWTRSLYESYPYDSGDGREDLEASGSRVLRGGAFHKPKYGVRCAYRGYGRNPHARDYNCGFRVVVSPFSRT
jgi:DNA helicase-2/ATP-dependent DNA helicase PcrA